MRVSTTDCPAVLFFLHTLIKYLGSDGAAFLQEHWKGEVVVLAPSAGISEVDLFEFSKDRFWFLQYKRFRFPKYKAIGLSK